LIPRPIAEDRDKDTDYRGDREDLAAFTEHIAKVHITPRMWVEAVRHRPRGTHINDWLVSENFRSRGGNRLHKEFINEKDPDTQDWDTYRNDSEWVDLGKKYPRSGNNAVCYAFASLLARAPMWARLYLGCNDGIKVFFNGKEVYANDGNLGRDEGFLRLALKKGRNSLLLKIVNKKKGKWRFCAHLTDHRGEEPKGVSARLKR
jgi:hypothetical protein